MAVQQHCIIPWQKALLYTTLHWARGGLSSAAAGN